ncbi:MAG: adenylate/guanylate cyclase domain-containing protein [Thalassobium sp.]|nr:MAG: adenylate/guanylate cyclase domain-containing protein [Thalassobium sp.]
MRWGSLSRKRLPVLLGVLLTIYFILLSLQPGQSPGHWLKRLDFLLYDLRFNAALDWHPPERGGQPIIIIDIDEKSLAQEGQWPWSRHKLADLVTTLAQYGAVVVAFDVVFSEPERNPVDDIRKRLALDGERWLAPDGWRRQVDADTHFAQELPATDVVLGFFFLDEANVSVGQLPAPVYELPPESARRSVVITKPGYAANLPLLQDAAAGAGFVTTFADADGAIRLAPLIIRYGNELYPSLALATVMAYLFDRQLQLETVALGEVDVLRYAGVGGQLARTDAAGRVIVPYKGPKRTFPYLSATDVLNGNISPDALEGAIVLVGTSALGLSDLRATPVGTQYPGVEVHANIIDALLNDEFPYRPEWEAGALLAQLLLFGLLLSFWLPRLGPFAAISVSGIAVLLGISGNFYLWAYQHLDLPLAAVLLLVGGLTIINLGYGFISENVSRRLLKGMFDQYVPPAHIERMMNDPAAYQFAGESKELTVLFSDIRSFTNISESLSAADLKALLNSYFTPVTKVIFDHEGTIDKYVGDMVMAFWGAPLDDERHAFHAVQAALSMQQVTASLCEEFAARGWPAIKIGIGINSGQMNVGDMGSSYRRAYTVLGDAVNLGSRLESITKFYDAEILVGEHTQALAPEFVYRYIDRIQVKGKNEPVRVYEPLGRIGDVEEAVLKELQMQQRAVEHYFARRWDDAVLMFTRLEQQQPRRLYQVYIERIADLRQQALPEDWDGVFRHTAK